MKLLSKIWFLLDGKDKLKFIWIIFFLLLASFLEILGIGLIIPAFSLFTESEKKFFFLDQFNIKDKNHNELLIVVSSVFLVTYLVKSIALTTIYKYQTSFLYNFQAKLTTLLFKGYIYGPTHRLLNKKSSEIIRNLTIETDQLIFSLFQPLLNFIAEFIFFLSIFLVLLFFQMETTLIIGFITICLFFIYFSLSKNFIQRLGSIRQYGENLKIKILQESIGGIRDLVTLNVREKFINKFKQSAFTSSNSKSNIEFINYMPKIWIEFLAVMIVFLLIYYLGLKETSFKEILPILGLYAFAGFRLIPIINRLVISYNHIKYGNVVLETVHNELLGVKKNKNLIIYNVKKNFIIKKIELRDVNFNYENRKSIFNSNVNLNFIKGDRIAICGESGIGKSTLADLIVGFLNPTNGKIIINDDQDFKSFINYKNILGYVPQDTFFYEDSIINNIILGRKIKSKEKMSNILRTCLLTDLVREKKESSIGEKGVNLSRGQKQRISLARALFFEPRLLLLDEATNSLDSDSEDKIINNIFNMHNIDFIFIISHQKNVFKKCNKIIKIKKDGKILVK